MIFQSKADMYYLLFLKKFPMFTNINNYAILRDAPYLKF